MSAKDDAYCGPLYEPPECVECGAELESADAKRCARCMTPPADPRTVLRALVAAGERATGGEWPEARWVNLDGVGGWAAIGPHHRGEDDDTDEPGSPSDELALLDASFIAAASAARPALSAIAGKVWLDVETVRGLIDAGLDASVHDAGAGSGCHACEALAAAEAELRAVEEGR